MTAVPAQPRMVLYRHERLTQDGHREASDYSAIITRVHDDNSVDLFVMESTRSYHVTHVREGETGNTWHWPPRV